VRFISALARAPQVEPLNPQVVIDQPHRVKRAGCCRRSIGKPRIHQSLEIHHLAIVAAQQEDRGGLISGLAIFVCAWSLMCAFSAADTTCRY
jgi:hypothetical protein